MTQILWNTQVTQNWFKEKLNYVCLPSPSLSEGEEGRQGEMGGGDDKGDVFLHPSLSYILRQDPSLEPRAAGSAPLASQPAPEGIPHLCLLRSRIKGGATTPTKHFCGYQESKHPWESLPKLATATLGKSHLRVKCHWACSGADLPPFILNADSIAWCFKDLLVSQVSLGLLLFISQGYFFPPLTIWLHLSPLW